MKYFNKVFHLEKLVNCLSDTRKRRTFAAEKLVMCGLSIFLLQYASLNFLFNGHGCMTRKLQHLLGSKKIPSRYAVEDHIARLDCAELNNMLIEIGRAAKKNKVLKRNAIDGYVSVGMDGVELYSSSRKVLPNSLKRRHSNGTEDEYIKSVVAMTVGGNQKMILGHAMLKPGDGTSKGEGELSGAHRLLDQLHEAYGRFADVIVMDALYLNAPLLKHVDELNMIAVVRLKGKQRLLYKDYKPLFDQDEYRAADFDAGKTVIQVWDCRDAQMTGYERNVRLLRFRELSKKSGQRLGHDMWVVTTGMEVPAATVWRIMHQRWDIELNGFQQLKSYYHVDHCFSKQAIEQFFLLGLIAFNLREAYLFGHRIRDACRFGITRLNLTEFFRNDLEANPLGLFPDERMRRRKRRKQ